MQSQKLTTLLLAYRQTILIAVYSHLLSMLSLLPRHIGLSSPSPPANLRSFFCNLVLDPSAQVWWRWSNILFTLSIWAIEIILAGEGGGLGEKWKVE